MKRVFSRVLGPTVLLLIVPHILKGYPLDEPNAVHETRSVLAVRSAPVAAVDTVSIYAGVYTLNQADRGEAIQRAACSACHSPPDWARGRVLSGWNGRSVYEFVSNLQSIMPLDAPGSLSLQHYTDIAAYMLELNSVPPGDTELSSDEDAQREIRLEYRR